MLGNLLFFFLPEGPVTVVFELFHIKLLKHFNRALIEFVRLKENKLKGFEITLCNHDMICDKGAGLSRALTSPLF